MFKKLALPVLAVLVLAAGAYYFFAPARKTLPPPEAGIPIYPGAQSDSDSFSARLSPKDRARLIKAVILQTEDPPGKVIEYYKRNLGGKARILEMKNQGTPTAIFQVNAEGTQKVVSVRLNDDTGKTEIFIGYGDPNSIVFKSNRETQQKK